MAEQVKYILRAADGSFYQEAGSDKLFGDFDTARHYMRSSTARTAAVRHKCRVIPTDSEEYAMLSKHEQHLARMAAQGAEHLRREVDDLVYGTLRHDASVNASTSFADVKRKADEVRAQMDFGLLGVTTGRFTGNTRTNVPKHSDGTPALRTTDERIDALEEARKFIDKMDFGKLDERTLGGETVEDVSKRLSEYNQAAYRANSNGIAALLDEKILDTLPASEWYAKYRQADVSKRLREYNQAAYLQAKQRDQDRRNELFRAQVERMNIAPGPLVFIDTGSRTVGKSPAHGAPYGQQPAPNPEIDIYTQAIKAYVDSVDPKCTVNVGIPGDTVVHEHGGCKFAFKSGQLFGVDMNRSPIAATVEVVAPRHLTVKDDAHPDAVLRKYIVTVVHASGETQRTTVEAPSMTHAAEAIVCGATYAGKHLIGAHANKAKFTSELSTSWCTVEVA